MSHVLDVVIGFLCGILLGSLLAIAWTIHRLGEGEK